MVDLSRLVYLVFGFKPSDGSGYPCHWCGVLTTLLDAEDFHVCEQHQREYIAIGYGAMKKKYLANLTADLVVIGKTLRRCRKRIGDRNLLRGFLHASELY